MVISAERAGAHVALAARLGKPARGAVIALNRQGRGAGAVVDVAAGRKTPILGPEAAAPGGAGAATSTAVIGVAIVEGGAVREIPLVIVNRVVVVPVVAPMAPAPTVTAEEADAEAYAEEQARPAIPDPWVGIPTRPGYDSRPVDEPGVIGREVYKIGSGRVDDEGGALGGDARLFLGT